MEICNLRTNCITKNKNCSNHTIARDERMNNSSSVLKIYNDNEVLNNDIALDNSILKPLEDLSTQSLEDESQIRDRSTNIARTLAYNHPLMLSPTYTDSDSEFDNQIHMNQRHCRKSMVKEFVESQGNYPDVVPTLERLHIQIPQTEQEISLFNSRNINCDKNLTKNKKQSAFNLQSNVLKSESLRPSSPDLLSSGSEMNVSQYQTSVDPYCQTVALMSQKDLIDGTQIKHLKNAKKGEDISSLDSISNQSFDGDEEHNLASLSPSSSVLDGLDDDVDDCEILPDDLEAEEHFGHKTRTSGSRCLNSLCANALDRPQLPQYSAVDERRDSRNWQKITLPDGRTHDIDMRVIEPYKRVLSHGGYLKAGGHNAIVIFCACHLPDRSRTDYSYVMDNLFLYVVKTLEQLVTDDYVLIYLHGGSSRRNMPPFPWLKKCYQLLDRRLRKSLKIMYLVHPTFWIKSLIWMTRPFVSTKFWRKLIYVKSLDELSQYVTALEKTAIPEKVKQYDSKRH